MYTDSFIVYIKPDDIYKDIAEDIEKDLTLQIMIQNAIPLRDHCQQEKIKK